MTDVDIVEAVDDGQPDDGWHPLPPRARTMFTLSALLASLPLLVGALVAIGVLLPDGVVKTAAAVAALAAVPSLFVWKARKRYRYTRWRLDADGFALRRGRFWSVETRVPGSRVQHLDLVRGPLQRRFDLATLVIHTAGTRQNAVSVSGMDTAEAERLRNVLAQGTADDDDA
jgi:uncharacterized protein